MSFFVSLIFRGGFLFPRRRTFKQNRPTPPRPPHATMSVGKLFHEELYPRSLPHRSPARPVPRRLASSPDDAANTVVVVSERLRGAPPIWIPQLLRCEIQLENFRKQP